jgi:hypothetical protein
VRRRGALLCLLGVLPVSSAFSQSSPPDLEPKLGAKPIGDKADSRQTDKPKLQEPPRPPAVPDLSTLNAPATAPPPSR